jgi:hypothetical protein
MRAATYSPVMNSRIKWTCGQRFHKGKCLETALFRYAKEKNACLFSSSRHNSTRKILSKHTPTASAGLPQVFSR